MFCYAEAVLTSTHKLCFGAKIRKIGIPLHTPVYYIKVGFNGGIHNMNMFATVTCSFVESLLHVALTCPDIIR